MSSGMPDVAVPLQELQKALVQLEKDPCSPTPSQKAALEKYLDLLRDSQEELGELSQQCQNELRVARQAACTIYSTIGARAFILFAFTVNINTISKRKTTNPLIPAFRGWWQNRKTPDSLKTITEELCQEHAIEELVCDCSGAAKPPGRRGRSRTIGTHKRKTRGKKRGRHRYDRIPSEGLSQDTENEPPRKKPRCESSNPIIDIPSSATATRPDESDSASQNTYSEPIEENHTATVSVSFSTFVSYLLLSHERPGSAVDILCPFEGSLPYTTIILNEQQSVTVAFSREFMAGFMVYAGQLGRAGLKVPDGGFPVVVA